MAKEGWLSATCRIVEGIHIYRFWRGGDRYVYRYIHIDPRVYPCRWSNEYNSYEECLAAAKEHEEVLKGLKL